MSLNQSNPKWDEVFSEATASGRPPINPVIDGQLVEQWKADLSILRGHCSHLLGSRDVYRRTQHVIADNPTLNIPSAFFDLIAEGYAASGTLGVRRLVFPSGNAVCMMGMLHAFKRNLHLLTRTAAAARSRTCGLAFEERFPEVESITHAMIDADIDALKEVCRPLKQHADERLAHLAREPRSSIPTFRELHDALETIEGILLRYGPVVDGQMFQYLHPIFDHDWMAVFRVPWSVPIPVR